MVSGWLVITLKIRGLGCKRLINLCNIMGVKQPLAHIFLPFFDENVKTWLSLDAILLLDVFEKIIFSISTLFFKDVRYQKSGR